MVPFSGAASRLYVINCRSKIKPDVKPEIAVLEMVAQSPVDIAGSYELAVNESNNQTVINSYFSTSFVNLRDKSGRT
jgi:hypothetical protein